MGDSKSNEHELREYLWPDDAFWRVIEASGGNARALEHELSSLTQKELIGFQWTYETKVSRLVSLIDVKLRGQKDVSVSKDAEDDFAASVVAKGRREYEAYFDHPDEMPVDIEVPHETRLRWVASELYDDTYSTELPPVGQARSR